MNRLTALLGIVLTLGFAVTSGLACECPWQKPFEEEFAWSEAVFEGEAVSVNSGDLDTTVTFKAGTVWKGAKAPTLTLTTAAGPQACGFQFKPGSRYLVYATSRDSALQTSRCTRTRPIEYASDDVNKLRDDGWSPVVGGLRGRIILLPAYTGELQYYRIVLELENVSGVLGQRSMRFTPDSVDLQVMDKGLTPVPIAQSMYGGLKPLWKETLIPFRGSTRFDISFPGTGLMRRDRPVIDLGPSKVWPLEAEGFYVVSARLTIVRQKGDHPTIDWSGTLEMPSVVLRPFPKVRTLPR